MTHTPYQNIAKEFMDLWQKQVSSIVSDKQFLHTMLELLQSAQGVNTHDRQRSSTAAQSADAADAHAGVLAELAFRLAMCEKRLAALESGRKQPAAVKRGGAKPARARSVRRGKKPVA